MTDGEKKAIDDLFSLTHINGYINLYDQEKANIYTSNLKRWQNGVKVLLNLIQTQQEEIERLKQTELKTKGGGIKVTLEGLLDIEKKMLELEAEIEKKDKIIDEMAEQIYDEWYIPNIKTVDDVKEYFINKVEKENKDDN